MQNSYTLFIVHIYVNFFNYVLKKKAFFVIPEVFLLRNFFKEKL